MCICLGCIAKILSRKKSCHLFRFSDLTGTDYSERAISLAQSLANRDGFSNVKFLVCSNFSVCVCVCEYACASLNA